MEQLTNFWPHIAAGFDLLAVLLASSHALLHKRDPRAATLWLGFIWLLPVLGPAAYLVLGVNRIRRRAVTLENVDTGLPFNSVLSICEASNHTVWAVTQNGVLVSKTGEQWNSLPVNEQWPGDATR